MAVQQSRHLHLSFYPIHPPKVAALEQLRDRHTKQIEHLQNTTHKKHQVVTALRAASEKMQEDVNEGLIREDALTAQVNQSQREIRLLQDQVRLYSGSSGVQLEDLQQALTMVKQRKDMPSRLVGEGDGDTGENDGANVVQLRRELESLRPVSHSLTLSTRRFSQPCFSCFLFLRRVKSKAEMGDAGFVFCF